MAARDDHYNGRGEDDAAFRIEASRAALLDGSLHFVELMSYTRVSFFTKNAREAGTAEEELSRVTQYTGTRTLDSVYGFSNHRNLLRVDSAERHQGSDRRGAMTQRAEAKLAGYTYLAYIVFAMLAAVLSGKTTAGADTSHMLSTLRSTMAIAQLTVLLDLLQIVCAVVLAVSLYRLTRTVDATLALLAVVFRFGEGLLGFVPLLGKLELMKLATASNPLCASSGGCLAIAGEIFNRPDDLFGQFCFVLGGFLFAYLFLAGRLIPRWMAWTGVITIGLQLVCVPLYVATLLPGRVVNWLWFPILLYEVPLGLWLILRGFKRRRRISNGKSHSRQY